MMNCYVFCKYWGEISLQINYVAFAIKSVDSFSYFN